MAQQWSAIEEQFIAYSIQEHGDMKSVIDEASAMMPYRSRDSIERKVRRAFELLDPKTLDYGTFVALGDIHWPLQDWPALSSTIEFILDFKPSRLYLMGDILNMHQVSPHEKDKHVLRGMTSTMGEDYQSLREQVLEPLHDGLPTTKKIYALGNHEHWVYLEAEKEGRYRDYFIERWFSDLFDEIIPYTDDAVGNLLQFGKLWLTHGSHHNLYHAATNAAKYVRPIRTWHCHTWQAYTMSIAGDIKNFKTSWSVPCLCNLNPSYRRNKPNAWQHGFIYGEVLPSGDFQDYPIIINDGRFRAEGKWYSG